MRQCIRVEFNSNSEIILSECELTEFNGFDKKAFSSVSELKSYILDWIKDMIEKFNDDGINFIQIIKRDNTKELNYILDNFHHLGYRVQDYAGVLCFVFDSPECWQFLKTEYDFGMDLLAFEAGHGKLTVTPYGDVKFYQLSIWFGSNEIIERECLEPESKIFNISKYGEWFLHDIISYLDKSTKSRILSQALKGGDYSQSFFLNTMMNGLRASIKRGYYDDTQDIIQLFLKNDTVRFKANLKVILSFLLSKDLSFLLKILHCQKVLVDYFNQKPLIVLNEYLQLEAYPSDSMIDICIKKVKNNTFINLEEFILCLEYGVDSSLKHLESCLDGNMKDILVEFQCLDIVAREFAIVYLDEIELKNTPCKACFYHLPIGFQLKRFKLLNGKSKMVFKRSINDYLLEKQKTLTKIDKYTFFESVQIYYENGVLSLDDLEQFTPIEIRSYAKFLRYQLNSSK